jgi:hypothetical protein
MTRPPLHDPATHYRRADGCPVTDENGNPEITAAHVGAAFAIGIALGGLVAVGLFVVFGLAGL